LRRHVRVVARCRFFEDEPPLGREKQVPPLALALGMTTCLTGKTSRTAIDRSIRSGEIDSREKLEEL